MAPASGIERKHIYVETPASQHRALWYQPLTAAWLLFRQDHARRDAVHIQSLVDSFDRDSS
ncbi:MAG: hypothetical protein R3C24_17705 [Cyanobacteriota/Melainabacteria group bacterium]